MAHVLMPTHTRGAIWNLRVHGLEIVEEFPVGIEVQQPLPWCMAPTRGFAQYHDGDSETWWVVCQHVVEARACACVSQLMSGGPIFCGEHDNICDGTPNDSCRNSPDLGRCAACHYIYHDIPQDSDNAHDELCCQSVHGCQMPGRCATHFDDPIGGVTPPPLKFVEEDEEVAPLFNEDGTPSEFTIQMLQGKGF